jgi:hypothetical protein
MNNQSSIKVKLLSNGRYTWEINVLFDANHEGVTSPLGAVELSKYIDIQLKEQFPDHTVKSFGRTVELDD